MNWLWQGMIITVTGGLVLALVLWVIKNLHEYIKVTPKKEQSRQQKIKLIEDALIAKKRSYKSVTAFYEEFDDGSWQTDFTSPVRITARLGKRLKKIWLQNADFTISYDSSNIQFMRFVLIAKYLKKSDIDRLLELPTKDKHGNWQAAGKLSFMKYILANYPKKASGRIIGWIEGYEEHEQM